jgi:hypothetical protein
MITQNKEASQLSINEIGEVNMQLKKPYYTLTTSYNDNKSNGAGFIRQSLQQQIQLRELDLSDKNPTTQTSLRRGGKINRNYGKF